MPKEEIRHMDLQRLYNWAKVFDGLDSDKNYTLRQIACAILATYNLNVPLDRIVRTLKLTNDRFGYLRRNEEPIVSKFSGKIMAYRYLKSLSAEEIKDRLSAYNNIHYKTPLQEMPASKVKENRTIDDFF